MCPQTFAGWERQHVLPSEVFASAAWHTRPLCRWNTGNSPPGPVGQVRYWVFFFCPLWPPHSVATFPCGSVLTPRSFLVVTFSGSQPPLSHSNHPTSYGPHFPLWSPLPVVNPPGHLHSRFMLTTRRKKPFLPLSPLPLKLALPSSQAPDLGSHGQPCLAGWVIRSESLLCA